MNINAIFEKIIAGHSLTERTMRDVIEQSITGTLSDIHIAVFLGLMRMKGETVHELSTAAQVLKQHAHTIDLGQHLIDIVGTGGDGKNTFNVSTVSSFVAAAAGCSVAKHGNQAVSGKSGSADLLTEAGFVLALTDDALGQCMRQCNMTFLFAPHFHQALFNVKHARQQLGIRTLFNLLGPLINPASVTRQIVGVSSLKWLKPIAEVLQMLGSEHALVLNARDGLDEISISSVTDVIEYQQGTLKSWSLDPKDYDCAHSSLDSIIVNNPAESLALASSVFRGEKGPARDIILLNSAAAIYCAGMAQSFSQGILKAIDAIDSGAAQDKFLKLCLLTQTFTSPYDE
jgi:anthranilate phosphoribosyltransferase